MPEKKLFLIPCCASKKHNGHSRSAVPEPLSRLVSEAIYSGILETRREVLSGICQDKRYLSGKYEKNRRLEPGPDFGGQSASGLYLPAVQRYKGTLYSNVPALSSRSNRDGQILILSALYGPLHPLSRIQDYNLQMSINLLTEHGRNAFRVFFGTMLFRTAFRRFTSFSEAARTI